MGQVGRNSRLTANATAVMTMAFHWGFAVKTNGSAMLGLAKTNGARAGRNHMAHSSGDHCAKSTAYRNGQENIMPKRQVSPLRRMPQLSSPTESPIKAPAASSSVSFTNGRASAAEVNGYGTQNGPGVRV